MKFYHRPEPNRETAERIQRVFLTAYRRKFPAAYSGVRNAGYFIRGLATGVAGMIIFWGASAYADQRNVGPDNVLYPLKRSQEFLTLAFFTADAQKPETYLRFATRRLGEIEKVTQASSSSRGVEALETDLQKDLERSLEAIKIEPAASIVPSPQPEPPASSSAPTTLPAPEKRDKSKVCVSLDEFINDQETVFKILADHNPKLLENYAEKCGLDADQISNLENRRDNLKKSATKEREDEKKAAETQRESEKKQQETDTEDKKSKVD